MPTSDGSFLYGLWITEEIKAKTSFSASLTSGQLCVSCNYHPHARISLTEGGHKTMRAAVWAQVGLRRQKQETHCSFNVLIESSNN